jgi:glycosyltransferase involved in cell wall biosynthesis
VAGDAALYFNPYDANELANTMEHFIADTSLQQDLKIKAKNRVTQFSWNKAAQAIQDALIPL